MSPRGFAVLALAAFPPTVAAQGITPFWRPNEITPAAIAADPILGMMQSWSLMVRTTAGVGQFDPDGQGPLTAYSRAFVFQIPEPVSAAPALMLLALARRQRRPRWCQHRRMIITAYAVP